MIVTISKDLVGPTYFRIEELEAESGRGLFALITKHRVRIRCIPIYITVGATSLKPPTSGGKWFSSKTDQSSWLPSSNSWVVFTLSRQPHECQGEGDLNKRKPKEHRMDLELFF